jgi:hypothetical protein
MSESAEVPFVSGMEREPEKLCETTVHLGKKIFALDGMLERVLEKARMAMGRPDRGPDPDVPDDYNDDDIRRLASIIERLASRPPSNYNNGGSDSGDLKRWIAGVGAALAASGIIAGWTLSNQVAAQTVKIENLTDQMRDQSARINRIEQQVNDRR